MAEGRRDTELRRSSLEIGPTTGSTRALAPWQEGRHTPPECEGQGSCPLACLAFGHRQVNHQINVICCLPVKVTLLAYKDPRKVLWGGESFVVRHLLQVYKLSSPLFQALRMLGGREASVQFWVWLHRAASNPNFTVCPEHVPGPWRLATSC